MTGCVPNGSMTALATPFKGGMVDELAFIGLCQRQLDHGSRALVVCGSTGEAAALSLEEQDSLICLAVAVVDGQIPVIAGCGGPSTEAAVAVARLAARAGASALLCAPTPYVKPSQAGIIAHMRRLAQVSGLPLTLYDVPGRVGVALRDETIASLFSDGVAVGLKDATADLSRPPRLRALCGEAFVQLSGDDATAAAYRAAGGDGCISVTANVAPALCASLHRAWACGDLNTFAAIRDLLAPLHDGLFMESNPGPLKAALALLGLASDEVRPPLTRATEATTRRLEGILDGLVRREEQAVGQLGHALAA